MLTVELRDLSEDSLDQLLRWRNDDKIRRFMYHEHIIKPEEHRAWYDSVRRSSTSRYWVMWANGRIAGLVNLADIDRENGVCEWAFYIGDAEAQKLGLGRIVEFHTLDHVFLTLGLQKLNCAVLEFNKAVVNMHKSFGFQDEGLRRSQIQKPEGRVSVNLLGLLKEDWMRTRSEVFEKKIKPLGEYSFKYSDGTQLPALAS